MSVRIPSQHLIVAPSAEWLIDASEANSQRETFGTYLRSVELGLYVNVRGEAIDQPCTLAGLLAVLRAQSWASPVFDEWSSSTDDGGPLIIVGGSFEMTEDKSGEVVLEAFVSDGHFVANLATPGTREVIRAATPAIQRLARTVSFSP